MLQKAYFLAKIGADTAKNEPHLAEILPTDALRRLRKELVDVSRGLLERHKKVQEGPLDGVRES